MTNSNGPQTARIIARRYRVEAMIGRGGIATVYRAHDLLLDRTVAVKHLADPITRNAESRARFLNQARSVAALVHPNIATLHDALEEEGQGYLVLEYVEGHQLSTLLRAGPVPLAQAVAMARRLADALDFAHRGGLVHGDVKPANIIITGDGQPKLLDFGIARLVADTIGTTTPVGTPRYMAPEQLEGQRPTPRADLYALGLVLYEMLAGRQPFAEELPVTQRLARDPLPLRQATPAIPAAVEAVVMRALARTPEARYQDAAHFRDDLRRLQDEFGESQDLLHSARPAGKARPSTKDDALPVAPVGPVTQGARPATPPRRRHSLLRLGLAALGVAALGLGVIWTVSEPDYRSQGQPQADAQRAVQAPSIALGTSTAPTLASDAAAVPTPSPAPPLRPAPGTVLYQASWASGANGWPEGSGWRPLDGLLLNDGSNREEANWIPAPFQPGALGLDDYAVEAEIRLVGNPCQFRFGLIVREAYRAWVGLDGDACSNRVARLSTLAGLNDLAAGRSFDPGDRWHTYRVEVKGDTVQFLIDDIVIAAATDNRRLSGGKVGLWSQDAQILVGSFRVLAR